MKYLKIYSIFFKQYLKGLMEYRVDFLIGMVGFLFTQGAGLLFLYIIFQNITALAGFSLNQILLMYGLSLIPKGIDHLFFDNIWLLPRYVRQGGMDRYMLRPINALYVFLIERFQPDAFGEIILGTFLVITTLTNLSIPFDPVQFIVIFITLFIGIFIFTGLKLATASTSFWLKNSYPLIQVTYNLSDFMKYPITIFPKVMQVILTYVIPYALVSYYPAMYLFGEVSLIQLTLYLVLVTLFVIGLGLWVWQKGLKHYESTGS